MQKRRLSIPGASATTVLGSNIWELLFHTLCTTRTTLRFSFLSARRTSAAAAADFWQVWPMPLPYPEVHLRASKDSEFEFATKKGINFSVLVLNQLASPSRREAAFATPAFGTKLNRRQWEVVKRLRPLIVEWNLHPPVDAAAMGRAASKMESVETVLCALEAEVREVSRDLRSYCGKSSSGEQEHLHFRRPAGEVVGTLSQKVAHVAKAVEPDRLRFWKTPSFDPTEFLDPANRQSYAAPLDGAELPEESGFVPPRVKVRIQKNNRIKFLELLDSSDRLRLVPEKDVRQGYLNGVFCVPKDQDRDRMVLDARPPNGLEKPENRWIRSLASTQQLQHFFTQPGEQVMLFAEDLREFYHAFKISKQRVVRNCLEMPVSPAEICHLRCFEDWMDEHEALYPALNTMAMGDCNAVAYGQASHLGVVLQSQALELGDIITLTGRPGRKRFIAGLMIDDLVLLQRCSAAELPSETECGLAIEVIRRAYVDAGLPRHDGKAVYGEKRGTFWGLQMNGESCTARPLLSRCIPLVRIIAEVVRLQHCTVSLLEVISGSLISVFQCRRRFMSILDEIYSAQRGRAKGDIVRLPPSLQQELLSACALVALTSVDFKLRPSRRVVATDSSSTKEAAVSCFVGEKVVEELQKHALQKGLWNRLLSPDKAYLRQKGLLDEQDELPDKSYAMHPAFEELAATQQFRPFGKVRHRRARQHINLGEISAALEAEKLMGEREPDHYYLHMQDSQVSLAALVKGRSSSKAVNELIRSSIPFHVGNGVRPFYAFVRTGRNPADDPTRGVCVRKPLRPEALWLRELEVGKTSSFDSFIAAAGLSASDLQGLPDPTELGQPTSVDTRSSREVRSESRAERKAELKVARLDFPLDGRATECLQTEDVVQRRDTLGLLAEDEVQRRDTVCHPAEDEVFGPPWGQKENQKADKSAAALIGTEVAERKGIFPVEVATEERKGCTSRAVRTSPSPEQAKEPKRMQKLENWQREILRFPHSQFVISKKFKTVEEAVRSGPGILDLYSGSRGISKACVAVFDAWTLTFDIKHHPSEDLSNLSLQGTLARLIRSGAFRAMVAGPVCASFSTAVTPPCRSFEFPGGVPWCSEKQRLKNELGNSQLRFVQRLVRCCLESNTRFAVENPNGSWMWKQVGSLSWDSILSYSTVGDLKVDYCMFGCPWQKRTRFRTDLHLRDQKLFCSGKLPHVRLRGRCRERGVNYTQLAEPYPRALCHAIATAIGIDCRYLGGLRKKLDISSCARGGHARIGEAANPGPRVSRGPRGGDLTDVELLEPATIAMRARIWTSFVTWIEEHVGGGVFPWVLGQPSTLVDLLISFGHSAYKEGLSLSYYRQLLAHVQRENLAVRPFMSLAWQLVTKWELMEPTSHRPPLPEPVLAAMISLGLAWGWEQWTCTLIFSFFGACRVGEVLHARREHLLLPSDLLSDSPVAYLKIINPKSRRRGARTQYATVSEARFMPLFELVWNRKVFPKGNTLYGGSPGAFRSRWDAILKKLQIPKSARLTPGSLRAGGAVWLHKQGVPIADVLWRLRLQHQKTLTFYLQEVTAESVLPSLPEGVRDAIRLLRGVMPILLALKTMTFQALPE